MKTVLGGTFSKLHKGHKLMIQAAFETGNRVILGLTTDEYLKRNKSYRGYSYARRESALRKFMKRYSDDFEILPLSTRRGNTESDPEYAAMVVSRETLGQGKLINEARIKNGLNPLNIVTVPIVLAEDLFPLSSTRIISGELRPSGSRVTPIRICISTENELKRTALEKYLKKIMKNFTVEMNSDYALETEQPFAWDTHRYAIKRAMGALKDRDYGIGIESGVWRDPVSGKYIEQHVCVVIDRYSRVTEGLSSGFELPEQIVSLMKNGKNESEAFEALYGVSDIGKSGGVIGALSGNTLQRKDLLTECIRNAFVPRTGAEFFGLDVKL